MGLAVVLIRLLNSPVAFAQTSTTQPADEPAANSPIRLWFNQLADPDPKIRDKATFDLMGIPADNLPKLRQLVIDNQPIGPARSAALRDIVLQSFLAGQKYRIQDDVWTDAAGTGTDYFLGIRWPDNFVGDVEEARLGVTVDERLPGFPSYRFLRRGDMILGVYKNPDVPLQELPNLETHTRAALIAAFKTAPINQSVVLQVLRDGQTIRVPVKMAPRPLEADAHNVGAMEGFNSNRIVLAEEYWQQNFAPLLESRIDASNLAEAP